MGKKYIVKWILIGVGVFLLYWWVYLAMGKYCGKWEISVPVKCVGMEFFNKCLGTWKYQCVSIWDIEAAKLKNQITW